MKTSLDLTSSGRTTTYAVAVKTVSTQAVPSIRNRVALSFHNPGPSDVWFCQDQDAAGNELVAAVGAPGMFLVKRGDTLEIDAPGRGGWNCIAEDKATLTVLDYVAFSAN